MDSIVQFIIKLRAQVGNLPQVAAVSTRQLDRVRRSAERTGEALHNAFSLRGIGRGLMAIPGMQILTNPMAMAAAGVGAVARIGSEAEVTSRVLETLVGSQSKATEMIEQIRSYAERSPFKASGLTESARVLMNYDVAADKVVETLKQLGDISGGDAEKLHSLAIAYGQVVGNGRLLGQERLQFVNAGFNPLLELSKMTGKSMAELTKMTEEGRISAQNVAQAIAHATGEGGRFHKVIDSLADTTKMKFLRAVGELQRKVLSLFDRLRPLFDTLIDLFSRSINIFFREINVALDRIQAVIKFIKDWWMELALVGTIIGILTVAISAKSVVLGIYDAALKVVQLRLYKLEAITRLLNMTMRANPIGLVITIVMVLAAVVVYCWHKFAGFRAFLITMWDTLKGFGGAIKDYVINRINELLEGIGAVGKAIKLLFSGDFGGAADAVGVAIDKFSGRSSSAQVMQSTRELASGWSVRYNAHLQNQQAKKMGLPWENPLSKIAIPGLKGSESHKGKETVIFGPGKDGRGGKSGNAIATGGQRNTTINMTIGKLIETINVRMSSKEDSSELDEAVLRSVNRALAMATSTE